MDPLSRLIHLARPTAALDIRCLFSGPFTVGHVPEEPGVATFHLLQHGACVIETSVGDLHLQAGDFVLFPRGGAHRLRDVTSGVPTHPPETTHDGMLPLRRIGSGTPDVDLLCGRFTYAPGAAALLLDGLPDALHLSHPDHATRSALQALTALMYSETQAREAGALAIVTALSHALLAMALRTHSRQSSPGVLLLLADARIGPTVRLMLEQPAHPWTIDELSSHCAMSRATFARHFPRLAGMTVQDFLTRLRMTLAADLLGSSRRSAADIGAEVGYQSEAAFGKAFMRVMGQAPGKYRRNLASV